jgi:hypothetical protein
MRKSLILVILVLAASACVAAPVFALRATAGLTQGWTSAQTQTPPNPPPAGDARAGGAREGGRRGVDSGPALRPDEVQDVVDGWEMTTAERTLELSEQQYVPFIQNLRKLQEVRRRHLMQRQRVLGQLRQATNQQPPLDDATLEARLKQFDDFEKQSYQNIQTAQAALDAVLTVRQRARFRLVQEQIERQKLQLVARVMRAGGPGK